MIMDNPLFQKHKMQVCKKRVCYGGDSYLIVGGMDQGVVWRSQTGQIGNSTH